MIEIKNKKGQIAIWVILALVLAGGIILFFTLERGPVPGAGAVAFSPEQYIEKCTGDAVNEAVDLLLPHGGFLEPRNFKVYNDTNISYLCLHSGYFRPCTNQHPMLVNEIETGIKTYIAPRIESCFGNLKNEIEKRDSVIELGATSFNVSMAPGKVFVNIAKNVKITEKETTRTFEKFDVEVANPIYDLTNVALDIVNSEAKYCTFLYVGYMLSYPRWDVRIFVMSDSTKIYTIKDKESGKKMNIAIRGCAMPPGMGI
jgi:hypothetical protein